MAITLNHTIVPARDKAAAAQLFAQVFGLAYKGQAEHFAPVKVNDTLTFLFDDETSFESHHYAFHVTDEHELLQEQVLCGRYHRGFHIDETDEDL